MGVDIELLKRLKAEAFDKTAVYERQIEELTAELHRWQGAMQIIMKMARIPEVGITDHYRRLEGMPWRIVEIRDEENETYIYRLKADL